MVTRYENFEQMVESAQRAINDCYRKNVFKNGEILKGVEKCNLNDSFDETQIAWLQSLLDILKEGKYATIQAKNGTFLDVSKIANTHDYASFFDVINQINCFDMTIEPKITEKLKNTYFAFYKTIE